MKRKQEIFSYFDRDFCRLALYCMILNEGERERERVRKYSSFLLCIIISFLLVVDVDLRTIGVNSACLY